MADINLNLDRSKLFTYVGIIGAVLGLIIGILGVIISYLNLSLGIALVSLGIAVVSLGTSSFAIGLSIESADRMKAIANANFLQVVNMFEDTRIHFVSGLCRYHVELFIWKSLSLIEMANELLKEDKKKNFIEKKYQNKLVNYFNISMKELFLEKDSNGIPYTWSNLQDNQRSNLARAYCLLRYFHKEDSTKEDLEKVFNDNLKKEEMDDFRKKVKEYLDNQSGRE